jgi:hypothetical protein
MKNENMFDYIDDVKLSPNMKARLITTTESTPERSRLTFASKNLIAIGASVAAIMIMFGGLMFFLPNDNYGNNNDGHGVLASNAVTSHQSEANLVTATYIPSTDISVTTMENNPPLTDVALTEAPVTEAPSSNATTITRENPDTPRAITPSRAEEIALERFHEGWWQGGEIKSNESAMRKNKRVYRIEVGRKYDDYVAVRIDICVSTGEIIKEYDLIQLNNVSGASTDMVKIVVNRMQFGVIANWNHGSFMPLDPEVGGGMSASGSSLSPWHVSGVLPAIEYSSNFRIEVVNPDVNINRFSLFDEDYDAIYEWQPSFTAPTRPGVYYLAIWGDTNTVGYGTVWTDSGTAEVMGNRWSSYDFWVKIVVS